MQPPATPPAPERVVLPEAFFDTDCNWRFRGFAPEIAAPVVPRRLAHAAGGALTPCKRRYFVQVDPAVADTDKLTFASVPSYGAIYFLNVVEGKLMRRLSGVGRPGLSERGLLARELWNLTPDTREQICLASV